MCFFVERVCVRGCVLREKTDAPVISEAYPGLFSHNHDWNDELNEQASYANFIFRSYGRNAEDDEDGGSSAAQSGPFTVGDAYSYMWKVVHMHETKGNVRLVLPCYYSTQEAAQRVADYLTGRLQAYRENLPKGHPGWIPGTSGCSDSSSNTTTFEVPRATDDGTIAYKQPGVGG